MIGKDKDNNKYWIYPSDPYKVLWREKGNSEEWKYYKDVESINQLITSLDTRGRREYVLYNQLNHIKQTIINNYKKISFNNSFPFLQENSSFIKYEKTVEGYYPEAEGYAFLDLLKIYDKEIGKDGIIYIFRNII